MPTIIIPANWGSDVDSSGSKFPLDGSDYCGEDSGFVYRVANKFSVSAIPTNAVITNVDYDIYVSAITSAGTLVWSIGPYNGNGQADPEVDTGATMYARCDISANSYLSAITDYRTIGQKNHLALGAGANADVQAALAAGIFSMAVITNGTPSTQRTEFREYNHGTTPPRLTVTYNIPTGGRIMGSLAGNGGLAGTGGLAGNGGGMAN